MLTTKDAREALLETIRDMGTPLNIRDLAKVMADRGFSKGQVNSDLDALERGRKIWVEHPSDGVRGVGRVIHLVAEQPAAIRDVLAEREKQRTKWALKHDDQHADGCLAAVASYLAYPPADDYEMASIPCPDWAEALERKHPERRDQLVIAAALLLAEIERIDRISS